MRVIGTAGHVDHGKSTLVAALTGTHPDRLKEEREREMTIDLGFAWMTLPGPQGETLGIVDVPGHRDFIENMLAGVGGIDAALFVVAADEGVMPQTREHLAILDLLQVPGGVVALTKTDLAPDPDWLALVQADVRDALRGTVLEDAPVVPVSARSGAGLPDLLQALAACLAERPPRPDLGRARLPVDRVFTIAGFGTVLTGTLIDGQFKVGDEIEVLPSGLRGRIRGLQTHKQKEQSAQPGSRTAVNLSGVEVDSVRRGNVLAHPGRYRASNRLDVHFKLLADAAGPLRHASEVKFFTGSAEVLARVRLLGVEELAPGQEGWLQLDLREPVVAVRGDRYILRRPSPSETLGGGVVVDAQPARHRRFDPPLIESLEALLGGSPADVLLQAFQALGPAPLALAVTRARLNAEQAAAALEELNSAGLLAVLEPGTLAPDADVLCMVAQTWEKETARALEELQAYHRANPLRRGMPREELKSRLRHTPRLFAAALRRWLEEGLLAENGGLVSRAGWSVTLTPAQQAQAARLLARFAAAPFAPPSVKEAQADLGEGLYTALVERGDLVPVSAEVVFDRAAYASMRQAVDKHFAAQRTLTVIEFRDRFNTSRKYALGFLEHLDSLGITQREGDFRIKKR